MSDSQVKVGVALGSGAFRGLAHIGILEVLTQRGIPIDVVAGSSMGAIIGGIFCVGVELKLMRQLISTLDEKTLIDVGIPRMGFVKGERIQQLLLTLTGNRDFSQTKIPFAAVAVDIEQGELVIMQEGKLHQAMRASMSIPGVFEPVRWKGRLMVDGGVLCRVPVNTARSMGADVVIGVDVGTRGEPLKVKSTMEVMLRSLDLLEWDAIRERIKGADVMMLPELYNIDPWGLTDAEECMQIGRECALNQIDEIEEAIEKVRQQKSKKRSKNKIKQK